MICPKCDLEQEERLDCKECGVIFSKYKGLFVSNGSSDSTDKETILKSELHNLQIQVKDLSTRFIDIEFEKAERKKIRIELKDLIRQIQENQQQTEARIQDLEQMLRNSVQEFKEQLQENREQTGAPIQDLEQKLENFIQEFNQQIQESREQTGIPIQDLEQRLESSIQEFNQQIQESREQTENRTEQMDQKLENFFRKSEKQVTPETGRKLTNSEEIEQKTAELTDSLNNTIRQMTSLWEKTGQNSYQITELNAQVTAFRNDLLEMKNQLANIAKQQVDEEPKTIYEDDVKSIRKNLDELGQFISDLGRKE